MSNTVEVQASVAVVPYEGAEHYFFSEILSEGNYRDNVPFIPLIPLENAIEGVTYEEMALTLMYKVREEQGALLYPVDNLKIDIGLIDIQVSFKGNTQVIVNTLKQDSQSLLRENAAMLDNMTNGNIHNQMMIGTALHLYNNDGDSCIHYHNIIFSVRVENKIYSHLDLTDILSSISKEGYTIGLVAPKEALVTEF